MKDPKQMTFDEVENEQRRQNAQAIEQRLVRERERLRMLGKLKPQAQQVLFYIEEHGAITQREALNNLSCMRLPSRIHEIKKAGFPIESRIVTGINQFGATVHYAEYFVGGDD